MVTLGGFFFFFGVFRWVEYNQEAPYKGKLKSQYLCCERRKVELACTDLEGEREGEPSKKVSAGSFV